MGRPKIEVDEELLASLAGIGCTTLEMASILGCSKDTLERRFAALIEKGRSEMKRSLRRTQLRLAEEGNAAMAIWLGKQLLGQHEPKVQIDVNKLDSDIERELAALTSRGETDITGEAESEVIN